MKFPCQTFLFRSLFFSFPLRCTWMNLSSLVGHRLWNFQVLPQKWWQHIMKNFWPTLERLSLSHLSHASAVHESPCTNMQLSLRHSKTCSVHFQAVAAAPRQWHQQFRVSHAQSSLSETIKSLETEMIWIHSTFQEPFLVAVPPKSTAQMFCLVCPKQASIRD